MNYNNRFLSLLPFIVILIPLFFQYFKNNEFFELSELLLSILIVESIIVIIFVIIKLLIKNTLKTILILTIGITLLFIYSPLYDKIDNFSINGFYIKNLYVIGIFGIVFAGLCYFCIKTSKKYYREVFFTNIIAIGIISIIIINGLVSDTLDQSSFKEDLKYNSLDRLNIYYIVLDSYAHSTILDRVYGYNNEEFLSFLKNNGFYVVSKSHSNYNQSFLSLASSLNLQYVNYFSDELGFDSRNFQPIYEMIDENELMSYFKSKGYKIISFASANGADGNLEIADVNLCEKKILNSQFLTILLRGTIFEPFYVEFIQSLENERELCVFSELQTLDDKNSKPFFVYAHFLIPHSPYRFNSDGEKIEEINFISGEESEEEKIGYINQVQLVNKKISNVIDSILNSKQKSIIIIQSDTGTSTKSKDQTENLIRKMKILNAYYFPGDIELNLYETITPVNTFRIILNEYFDEEFEVLEDRLYYSPSGKELEFIDITEQFIKK